MRFLTLLLTFCFFSVHAQDFRSVPADRVTNPYLTDSSTLQDAYALDSFQYYIVRTEPKDPQDYGMKLVVFNPSGAIIFRSCGFMDSYTHTLSFFKAPGASSKTLILGHNSNEYSWGNMVYLLENGEIRQLGLLDVGTYDKADMPWDISGYTRIQADGNRLRFTFSCDTLTYNPGGRHERILSGKQIHYTYSEKGWEEIISSTPPAYRIFNQKKR